MNARLSQACSRAHRRGPAASAGRPPPHSELASKFSAAFQDGEVDQLVEFLAADAVFYGDGGGKARGLPRPIYGRGRVDRLLRAFAQEYLRVGGRMPLTAINGQPGTLNFDSHRRLVNVFVFETVEGVIQFRQSGRSSTRTSSPISATRSRPWPAARSRRTAKHCHSRPRRLV